MATPTNICSLKMNRASPATTSSIEGLIKHIFSQILRYQQPLFVQSSTVGQKVWVPRVYVFSYNRENNSYLFCHDFPPNGMSIRHVCFPGDVTLARCCLVRGCHFVKYGALILVLWKCHFKQSCYQTKLWDEKGTKWHAWLKKISFLLRDSLSLGCRGRHFVPTLSFWQAKSDMA